MDAQKIAESLLGEGYLLTALELHAELMERGESNKTLADFFADTSNFEKFTRKMDSAVSASPCLSSSSVHRVGSQVTLDDISRFSDDSHAHPDDRIAVLEFELRRARDTIQTLRSELTAHAATTKGLIGKQLGQGETEDVQGDASKDKNNIPKFPNANDLDEEEEEPEIREFELRTLNYLVNEYLLQQGYKLTSITFNDENADQDFEDWDSVGLNMFKPPGLLQLFRNFNQHVMPERNLADSSCQTSDEDSVAKLHEVIEEHNSLAFEASRECERLKALIEQKESELSSVRDLLQKANEKEALLEKHLQAVREETRLLNQSASEKQINDTLSNEDNGDIFGSLKSNCSRPLLNFLLKECGMFELGQKTKENDLVADQPTILNVLSDSVPRILPNISVAERHCLIPLFILTIRLHPESHVRDKLLNLLFNLVNQPDREQRKVILDGLTEAIQVLEAERIEAELLPQCWEQLNHHCEERRILVAATCGRLIPFIPSPLRSSLVLSMLNQLSLEDKSAEVRKTAVESLAVLVLFVHSDGLSDKFDTLWQTTSILLKDKEDEISERTRTSLLLSMSNWSISLGHLEPKICTYIMNEALNLCEVSDDQGSRQLLAHRIDDLNAIVPFLLLSIISSCPRFLNENFLISENEEMSDESQSSHGLSLIMGGKLAEKVLAEFNLHISKEWFEMWPQLQWFNSFFLKTFVQIANSIHMNAVHYIDPQLQEHDNSIAEKLLKLCHILCDSFGDVHVQQHLDPLFEIATLIESTNENLDHISRVLYLECVMLRIKSIVEVCNTLRSWSEQMMMLDQPTNSLLFIVIRLCKNHHHLNPLAEVSWALVVHPEAKIRRFASKVLAILAQNIDLEENQDVLRNKVLPGLVTLTSDSDSLVQAAAIPGLICVIATSDSVAKEKAFMQFINLTGDQNSIVSLAVLGNTVRVLEHISQKVREDMVLPRIVQLYNKFADESYLASSGAENKAEVALSCLSIIEFMSNSDMSISVHQNIIHPLLSKVTDDISHYVPEHIPRTDSLMESLETTYGTVAPEQIPLESPSTHIASRIAHSPSLDEMKQKMGKILKKNPNSPSNPFWKK